MVSLGTRGSTGEESRREELSSLGVSVIIITNYSAWKTRLVVPFVESLSQKIAWSMNESLLIEV
jgi:hypothetical protein